jgi:Tol biopolymer transport system component
MVDISHNAESDSSPSWSPDGKRIVFSSIHDEYSPPQLYVMDSDGTNRIKINRAYPPDMREPAWSPDGTLIAFFAHYGGEAVYIMHSDGSNVVKLLDDAFYPVWLPDGKFLASQNATAGMGFTSITNVATGKTERILDLMGGMWPTWSPNGKQIAFAVAAAASSRSQIYIANADGSNRTNISKNNFYDTHPAWSPVPVTIHSFPAEMTPVPPTPTTSPSLTPMRGNPATTEDPIQSTLFAQATIILQTVNAPLQETRPTYSMTQIQATQTVEKATLNALATSILATLTAQAK